MNVDEVVSLHEPPMVYVPEVMIFSNEIFLIVPGIISLPTTKLMAVRA